MEGAFTVGRRTRPLRTAKERRRQQFLCRLTEIALRVQSRRQREIRRREAALAVRGQPQGDLVPANIDVGMVVGLLGDLGHTVHEFDGLDEISEGEGADDFRAFEPPIRQALESGGDFRLG